MPLATTDLMGTESDGSKNQEYCKYCYEGGHFVHPEMTLDDMKKVVTSELRKRNGSDEIIRKAVELLPRLRRWKETAVSTHSQINYLL